MKYAIIAFSDEASVKTGNGRVYGWYESLATAINTATNLMQFGTVFQATVMKVV